MLLIYNIETLEKLISGTFNYPFMYQNYALELQALSTVDSFMNVGTVLLKLNFIMKKRACCICETEGTYQLHGNSA